MPTKKSSGLGKGLDSLIPTDFDESILLDKHDRIQKLLITTIRPNDDQPRKHFDTVALSELASSISRYGVLQPIIVTEISDNLYEIVAGERRWRASEQAKLTHIPAIIRNQSQLENLEISLIENVQRVDLSPIEQAVSIERLHQQFNKTYAEIATRLGKAPATVNNIVRLLKLPKSARVALINGVISEGHARAILSLKDFAKSQEELLQLITKKSWSVRQAEQYVVNHKKGNTESRVITKRMAKVTPETKRLSEFVDSSVTLRHTAKGGRIEISFKDDAQMKYIIERITKSK